MMRWRSDSRLILIALCMWAVTSVASAQLPEGTDEEARLMLDQGRNLANAGRAAESIPFYEQAVDMAEARLGTESPVLGYLLHELATVYRSASRLDRSEAEFRRALGILESVFGQEHREILPVLADLASLLAQQNRVTEAEELYRRTLALLRQEREEGDPEVVRTLGQLALLADQQGRTEEAEELYLRSIALADAGGQESPELASCLANLASLHHRRGELDDAEPLYRRALDLRQRLLGPNHWLLAVSLSDLGLVTARRGRIEEGLDLATRASAILAPYCSGLTADDPAERRSARELCRDTEALRLRLKERLAEGRPAGEGPADRGQGVDTPSAVETPSRASTDLEARGLSTDVPEPKPESVEVRSEPSLFRAQLASREGLLEARAELQAIQNRYVSILGDVEGNIETIDLGAKGVWHRIQFGGFRIRAAAQSLCDQLEAAGWPDCWIASSAD